MAFCFRIVTVGLRLIISHILYLCNSNTFNCFSTTHCTTTGIFIFIHDLSFKNNCQSTSHIYTTSKKVLNNANCYFYVKMCMEMTHVWGFHTFTLSDCRLMHKLYFVLFRFLLFVFVSTKYKIYVFAWLYVLRTYTSDIHS